MAPDAEKIRQRSSTAVVKDSATETTQLERVLRLDQLRGNEVCIDGVIYDLASFKHPGGESILTFGGNDATVTYKMIHPYHTEKHLEKMKRVGKVSDFVSEYKFGTDFEKEIKSEVFKIVRRGREFGTLGWFARAAFYITLFFSLQFLWATGNISWQLAVIYGLSQSLIGLNVQHDANHGAASKNHMINDILGLGADFIGGSKWLWIEQHWTHHSYTNHKDQDPDSFGAEPFLLFNDYPLGDSRRKFFHQFQGLFYPLVLSGYWLSSIFNPEILDLRQRGALGVGLKMESDYIKKSRKYAVFLRLLYILTNIALPLHNNGLTWNTIGLIILMGASDSLGLALLFALSHNFEGVDRDPTKSFRATGEQVCWYKSQVETSCTYGGFLAGALTGGLNFQVEHHLFPRMSSAWYPFIAPKVREICKKHGVKYAYYPWVFQNWMSTVKYIHAAGTGSNWSNPFKGNL